jgi:hypothetical protein
MHQQMSQNRRPMTNFMNSWSGCIRSLPKSWSAVGNRRRERKSWPGNSRSASAACMRVQMKMASDWSTFPHARKWRSKVRTSCTNESLSKSGTPQMDTPSTRSITAWSTEDEGCKHRFKPHDIGYKIENKNMPCQQHKATATETFRSRQNEG